MRCRLVDPAARTGRNGMSVQSRHAGENESSDASRQRSPRDTLGPGDVDPLKFLVRNDADMRRVQCGRVNDRIRAIKGRRQEPFVREVADKARRRKGRTIDPDTDRALKMARPTRPELPVSTTRIRTPEHFDAVSRRRLEAPRISNSPTATMTGACYRWLSQKRTSWAIFRYRR
ncbi:hypothetical protein FHT77_002553 [Rhizobium sp. BK181]|nr:hypothetical protein [Rhizobium sp. BK181]